MDTKKIRLPTKYRGDFERGLDDLSNVCRFYRDAARAVGQPELAEAAEAAGRFLRYGYGRRARTGPPGWCYWAQVLSFLLSVAVWESDARLAGDTYLASSQARDLFAKYEGVLSGGRGSDASTGAASRCGLSGTVR